MDCDRYSDNDSIGRDVFRAATSTTVMALLSNGTIQSLATSLMAAGVGASAGRMAAQQGEQHGTVLHQGRVFKKELTRVSEHASQALVAEGIHVPAKQIKKQLQRHPALQGSPEEVQARLIQRGAIEEGDSVQTGAAASLARGVAKVLGATLDLLIPSAHASEFTPEEYNQLHGYTDRQHEVRYAPLELAVPKTPKPLLWQAPQVAPHEPENHQSFMQQWDDLIDQSSGGYYENSVGPTMVAGSLYQIGAQVAHGLGGMARFARDAYLSSDGDLRLLAPEAHQAARDRLTNRFRAVGDAVVHYEDTAQHMMQAMQASFAAYQLFYERGDYFRAGRHFSDASMPVWSLVPVVGTGASLLRFGTQLSVKTARSSGSAILKLYDARLGTRLVPGSVTGTSVDSALAGVAQRSQALTLPGQVHRIRHTQTGYLELSLGTPKQSATAPKIRVKTRGTGEQQLTEAGLLRPELLSKSELAKVQRWEQARNQYLKKQRELNVSGLPESTKDLLVGTKADKVIQKSMTSDDLAAIFKESRGVEIVGKVDGRSVKHKQELRDSHTAISNVIVEIKAKLGQLEGTGQMATNEAQLLQQKLSNLSKIKDLHADLIREIKCQTAGPRKLKP